MTSQEETGFLPLQLEERSRPRRSLREWATLLAFGAIQWPWLLRSLDGGSEEAKQALLKRLDLPDDALPHLGSWKADVGLLTFLADHIEKAKPSLVVEFGTGASTLVMTRALAKAGSGRLISFDQHGEFVKATRQWLADYGLEADIRAVPLRRTGTWPGLWYDHGPLSEPIDLLLIDGPPWTIHPFTRGAGEVLFDAIAPGGLVVLDDAARPGERVVAKRWAEAWPQFEFELLDIGSKGALVGRRRN